MATNTIRPIPIVSGSTMATRRVITPACSIFWMRFQTGVGDSPTCSASCDMPTVESICSRASSLRSTSSISADPLGREGSGQGGRPRPRDQEQARRDHGQAEELAHCRAREQEAEKGVGLAEEFANDAGNAVADEEGAGKGAEAGADAGAAAEDGQYREEDDALEAGLIELAGVAGFRAGLREDHGPWEGGGGFA